MRPVFVFAALALGTACVPKGKYIALDEELQQTRSSLQATIAERDGTILQLEGEVSALEGSKKRLQSELEQAQATLEQVTDEKARAVANQQGLEGEVERMKQAIAELEARKAQTEARMNEYRDLVGRFQSMIDAGTLKVKIVNGRMVVAMATDILFPSGSATLRKDGQDAVTSVAQILASIPNREFQIEGHTDNVPVGSAQFPSNWDLGAARAIGVVQQMIAAGMPPDRISAASFGEFRPVDTNRTKEGKTANRRIEIVVVPDLSQLPGFQELSGT